MVSFKVFLEQVADPSLGHPAIFAPTIRTIKDPVMFKGSRHRKSIIQDPLNRKHARTVPKYKQADPNIIRKIEELKNSSIVKLPLSLPDIKKIAKKFNINSIPKDQTTKLKNIGLGITWDPSTKQFFLHKVR
jgi:hypothetical protein